MIPRPELEGLRRTSLAHSNYRPLLWGQSISLFGDYIAFVTLPLFVVRLTGSELDLGLTTASETLPMLVFGLAAGVWLDRANLRRSLIFADFARGTAFALLAVAVAADAANVYTVFAVAFIVGSMTSIFDSGLQAYLPIALTEEMLVTANSRLQLARTLAWTLGAAVGGLLMEAVGPAAAFAVNAATFGLSAVFLLILRDANPRALEATEPVMEALRSGLRHLWGDRRLRYATLGAALANFMIIPFEATLALFGREDLGLSEAGVGWLYATQSLIGAGGALVADRVARRLKLGRTFVVGLALTGIGLLGTAASSNFLAFAPVGVVLIGVGWVNVAMATLRQRLTPPERLGRVAAASRTIAWAGMPVGGVLGGVIGERVGLGPLYTGAAIVVFAVVAVLALSELWRNPVAVVGEPKDPATT
jgi:MFS family permease